MGLIPDCVDKTIERALEPLANNAGKTFGDLWYLVFGGVSQAAEKKRLKYQYDLMEFENSCVQQIEKVPAERRVEPNLQVVCQTLDDSKYCLENVTIREMFANLIAASVNADKKDDIHPSFSNIIKQMSPLDASFFAVLKPQKAFPICEYKICDGAIKYQVLMSNVLLAENENITQDVLHHRSISICLLKNLGLINTSFDGSVVDQDKDKYLRYTKNNLYNEFKKIVEKSGYSLEVKKGILYMTTLGIELWNACCDNLNKKFIDGVPSSFL